MNTDMIEILKAKRDALADLEASLADQVKAGYIGSVESALRFVKIWSQAVDAMVPVETTAVSRSLHPADDPGAVHYWTDSALTAECGRTFEQILSSSPVKTEVTCLDCFKSLS